MTIYLIDTPGFDDTTRSDTEVLKDIARWIGASYKSQILLHGIVYLHRISDPRLQASAKKNLLIFKKLCGQDALKKVILVTTMWDKVGPEEGEARERELIRTPEVWGYMMGKGSRHRRHLNTAETARGIVLSLASGSAIATSLQKELVDEQLSLDRTSAGQELESELRMERETWARRMRETETEMKEAVEQHDQDAEDAMREERDRFARQIKELEHKTDSLRLTLENLLKERDERVASLEHRLDHHQQQQQQQVVQAESDQQPEEKANRHTTASPTTEPPRTTAVLGLDRFTGVSPGCNFSNSPTLHSRNEFASLDRAALGTYENRPFWIARYSDNGRIGWIRTYRLAKAYPLLHERLEEDGSETLNLCILGPKESYYVQWMEGDWSANVATDILRDIEMCHQGGSRVYAMSLGHDETYCMSYGIPGDRKTLGHKYRLKGHYPKLQSFLQRHEGRQLSIQSVTLDPLIATDFVMVYCLDGEDSKLEAIWDIESSRVRSHVNMWWRRASGRGDGTPVQDGGTSGSGEPKEREAD